MIRNPVDDFCIHNNLIESNQVRDKKADSLFFVENLKLALLMQSNVPEPKLHNERVLVALLVQSVAQLIKHLKCTTDDRMRLGFKDVFLLSICVHPCPSVVKTGALFFHECVLETVGERLEAGFDDVVVY